MKNKRFKLLILASVSLVFSGTALSEVTIHGKSDKVEYKENRFRKLQTLHGAAFRYNLSKLVSGYFSDGEFRVLLDLLTELQDSPDINKLEMENRIYVLYWIAECNYRLEDFDKAYQHYLRLTMLINDKGHALFEEVNRRAEETRRKRESFSVLLKKKMKSFEPDEFISRKYIIPVLVIILVSLVLIPLFGKWHERFLEKGSSILGLMSVLSFLPIISRYYPKLEKKYLEDKQWTKHSCRIFADNELISKEQMLRQDGRISELALKECEEGTRDSPGTKYACLILEGHEMISKVNKYAPYPVTFISYILQKIRRKELNHFWAYTIFGFVFIGIWTASSYLIDVQLLDYKKPNLVGRFLVAATLIALLTGIRTMSRRTIESLDEVVTMLEHTESIQRLEKWIKSLLRSPWQFYIALVLLSICLTQFFVRKVYFTVDMIFGGLVILLASPLIWFILRAIFITNRLSTIRDLAVNPISPLKTLGLQKWISVIGTYALIGSIILTFGGGIPVIVAYLQDNEIGLGKFLWIIILLPFLIIFWTYPYIKLKGLVKGVKIQRMHFFKTMISQSFDDWIKFEERLCDERYKASVNGTNIDEVIALRTQTIKDFKPQLDQMDRYYKVFKVIDQSPESFIDIYAAFELAKVMGIPSLFALVTYLFSG
jgi:hypothetical protein